jgi:hypothetical protein
MFISPEVRLIDELNSLEIYCITNAIVYTQSGEELYRTSFPNKPMHGLYNTPRGNDYPESLGGSLSVIRAHPVTWMCRRRRN